MNSRQPLRSSVGVAAGAAGAVLAGALAARALRAVLAGRVPAMGGPRAYLRGVTIFRPPAEVYRFWRHLPALSMVLDRVESVTVLDEQRSEWTVKGPAGSRLRFSAEIVVDEPDRAIAWRSVDSPVPHDGRVEFQPAPGNRGTELRVWLTYRPPAGAVGAVAGRLTGDEPDRLLRDALRMVKQVLECGEVIQVDGQPSGRGPVRREVTEAVRQTVATGGRP